MTALAQTQIDEGGGDRLARVEALLAEGRTKEAERALRKLTLRDPDDVAAQMRLAAVALDRGNVAIARPALTAALRNAPDEPGLHALLGRYLEAEGRTAEAINAFASAISLKPDLEAAHRGLAPLLYRQKRYDEARKSAAIALKLAPGDIPLLLLLADIEEGAKRPEAVLAHLTAAIQRDTRNPLIARRLSETLLNLGKLNEATVWGNRAYKADPDDVRITLCYALALDSVKQHQEVVAILGKAIGKGRMQPLETAFAENLMARALTLLGRRDEALPHAKRATELSPNDAAYGSTYCRALNNLGRRAEALEFARGLKERMPDNAGAAVVFAYALRECGDLDLSEEVYRKALAAPDKRSEAEFGLALIHLIQGRYEEGFANYDARLEPPVEVVRPRPPLEMWDGTPDPDVWLVVLREQGMGDEFQFCRYVAAARERVGHLVYVTYPSMTRVLAPALDGVEVSAESMTGRKSDGHKWRWLPLMSLPRALGLSGDDIAGPAAYLRADPEAVARMAPRIAEGRLKVGIAWQGNPASQVEAGRSVPLAELAPLAGIDGVALYSLQKTHGLDQLDAVPFRDRIALFGEDFDASGDAFVDTAGAMMHLDLVVTSDTAVAHLAGALGRPCWLLLQHQAEWRWGLDGETTLWYPSMRLFRQAAPGDWASAVAPAAEAMAALVPPA